jgi:hypothetical protein
MLGAKGVGTAAVGVALIGGIVARFSLGRRRTLTAADIMRMDEQAFARFLRATGLDAKVEAVMTRRRAAR